MEDAAVKVPAKAPAKLACLTVLFLVLCTGCAATQSSVQIETNVYKPNLDVSSPAYDMTARISFESRS